MIGRAASQILLQIWEEDVPEIDHALELASQSGVIITIVAYCHPILPFARVYPHEPGEDEITPEYGGRWIVLSIDGQEIVTGIVSLGKESRAAWSSHLGIVMPITEQIKHVLYIAEMLNAHRQILVASFGSVLWNPCKKFASLRFISYSLIQI